MNPTTSTPAVIYECPDCETRYLDERRCPDCNLFCRRIGAGGTRAHCDEPVALNELVDQEATMPINQTGQSKWPPPGRSHGHHRADPTTVTGQFLLALGTLGNVRSRDAYMDHTRATRATE